jgi:hypothetical protein
MTCGQSCYHKRRGNAAIFVVEGDNMEKVEKEQKIGKKTACMKMACPLLILATVR